MGTALSLSDSLLDRLTSQPGFAAYDAEVPDNPAQAYAVIYPSGGASLTRGYSAQPKDLGWQAYVICVGRGRKQCLNTAELVRALLGGWRIATAPLNEVPINAQILVDRTNPGDVRYSLTLLFRTTTTRG